MLYLFRVANGTLAHLKKHQCTPETRAVYGCPSVDALDYWTTMNEEYVKFGARLASERKGVMLQRILARYNQAWMTLYSGDPVPLTSEGLPVDFLQDSRYLCPRIPWLGDISKSAGISDS